MIHNGDHAEFEIEWAGKDPKTRPDWPLPSFDARDWAEAFVAAHPNNHESDVVTWFANALMRGYDEGRKGSGPEQGSCDNRVNATQNQPFHGPNQWISG